MTVNMAIWSGTFCFVSLKILQEPAGFDLFLNYSGVMDVLARITQLQRASTLPLPEQNLMVSWPVVRYLSVS